MIPCRRFSVVSNVNMNGSTAWPCFGGRGLSFEMEAATGLPESKMTRLGLRLERSRKQQKKNQTDRQKIYRKGLSIILHYG